MFLAVRKVKKVMGKTKFCHVTQFVGGPKCSRQKKNSPLISQTVLITFILFFYIATLGNFGLSPKFLYTQEHNSETKAVGRKLRVYDLDSKGFWLVIQQFFSRNSSHLSGRLDAQLSYLRTSFIALRDTWRPRVIHGFMWEMYIS